MTHTRTQLARRPLPVDLNGNPYTPAKGYRWLTEKARADFAEIFDCEPGQVEFSLDARDRMDAYAAERAEREHPFTHRRPGARALSYAEKVY